MADIDHAAEAAVREAIKVLINSGKRAYSLSVPVAAEQVLVQTGGGTTTSAEAQKRVRQAIQSMVEQGTLEAHAEGRFDWKLLEKPTRVAGMIYHDDPDFEDRCHAEARYLAHKHTVGARQKYDQVYEHELAILLKKDSFTPQAS